MHTPSFAARRTTTKQTLVRGCEAESRALLAGSVTIPLRRNHKATNESKVPLW
jgi:hypothetical protein